MVKRNLIAALFMLGSLIGAASLSHAAVAATRPRTPDNGNTLHRQWELAMDICVKEMIAAGIDPEIAGDLCMEILGNVEPRRPEVIYDLEVIGIPYQ